MRLLRAAATFAEGGPLRVFLCAESLAAWLPCAGNCSIELPF